MEVTRIADVEPETPDTPVTLKICGNVKEIRYARAPFACPIKKINKDFGYDVRSGEIVEFRHTSTRADNLQSVAQSLRDVRDLVNANTDDPDTVLWTTLTYAANMQDPKQLYEDYKKFWKRFRYYLERHNHPPAEYLTIAEPQGRGAWHLHCLFLFHPNPRPFIPNSDMAQLWGKGFTVTKGLDGIWDPGLYLSCYLGDMSMEESIKSGTFDASRLAEVKGKDGTPKAIVKRSRLSLYPPKFRIYRCSKGVRRPVVIQTTEGAAQALIGSAPLTYEKTVAIIGADGETKNVLNWRQYNPKYSKEKGGGQAGDAGTSLPCSDAMRQISGTEGSRTGTP